MKRYASKHFSCFSEMSLFNIIAVLYWYRHGPKRTSYGSKTKNRQPFGISLNHLTYLSDSQFLQVSLAAEINIWILLGLITFQLHCLYDAFFMHKSDEQLKPILQAGNIYSEFASFL